MRFSDRDVERLDKLAEKLEMPDVMVVRQALREMAISRGVEPDGDGAE
jgi:predicted transcriptional regulator